MHRAEGAQVKMEALHDFASLCEEHLMCAATSLDLDLAAVHPQLDDQP
jgi:hypothetical protein